MAKMGLARAAQEKMLKCSAEMRVEKNLILVLAFPCQLEIGQGLHNND